MKPNDRSEYGRGEIVLEEYVVQYIPWKSVGWDDESEWSSIEEARKRISGLNQKLTYRVVRRTTYEEVIE